MSDSSVELESYMKTPKSGVNRGFSKTAAKLNAPAVAPRAETVVVKQPIMQDAPVIGAQVVRNVLFT